MSESSSTATLAGSGWLGRAREQGLLSALDVQFASRLAALYEEDGPEVVRGLALACRQESRGHVCADLRRLAAEGLASEAETDARPVGVVPEGESVEGWLEQLRAAKSIGRVDSAGSPEAGAPLVLDDHGRLYLRRSFDDERALAEAIRERVARPDLEVDAALAAAGIERGSPSDGEPEAGAPLRRALSTGLARPLTLVTGGPGTGKTTLVARLVGLVVEQSQASGGPPPRVRLLAPTGKAAAALSAAFGRQREALALTPDAQRAMPTAAETIHRALMPQWRRDALGRPRDFSLEADLVVVDEASMVDLALMRRLFAACASVPRLVLLGDPDQLASVEAGAVLAEIRAVAAGASVGLADSLVELERSHRFESGSDVGRLAEAIRSGDAEAALALLDDPAHPDVERCDADSVAAVRARLTEAVFRLQRDLVAESDAETRLERLAAHRVLCAHRRGPLGVDALCEVLDEASARDRRATRRSGWWPGRLLLVTQNAPDQDLWNGDVGLVEETPGGLRACFEDAQGGIRMLSPGRLPAHESAIAMSVHKSQGSEFEAVDLVLGAKASRLMTRELLYTGVTRARRRLRLHAGADVVREAIARRVQRDSGLAPRLREP